MGDKLEPGDKVWIECEVVSSEIRYKDGDDVDEYTLSHVDETIELPFYDVHLHRIPTRSEVRTIIWDEYQYGSTLNTLIDKLISAGLPIREDKP